MTAFLATWCAIVVLLLAWGACRALRALARRKYGKGRQPARCPCGCGLHIRDVPALPVDGIPLDDYDKRRLAWVIASYMISPDDDSADVREDHQ